MEARTVCPSLGLATAIVWLSLQASGPVHAQYIMSGPQMGPMMHPGVMNQGAIYPGNQWAQPSGAVGGMGMGLQPSLPPRQAQPSGRGQAHARSENFVVFADSPEWAQQVAEHAESERARLARHWLGEELPPWPQPCPIHVQAQPGLGAGGETRFQLMSMGGRNTVGNWTMIVQGTRERVLDSVLPHEITHTIFATYFSRMGKYVPRWADEGACTTVEHEAEKKKHRYYLQQFLRGGRGLAFNQMFRLKEYPEDILPLYAQGHSAVQFLIDQSSPQDFIQFIERGMQTEDWNGALYEHYGYQSIGEFQTMWNDWLRDGSPSDLIAYAPNLSASNVRLASNETPSRSEFEPKSSSAPVGGTGPTGGTDDSPFRFAITTTDPAPVQLARGASSPSGGSDSYYKNRLRAVQSGETQSGLQLRDSRGQGYHNATRRQQPQSTPVQVIDWGQSAPVGGIETTVEPKMVPIRR